MSVRRIPEAAFAKTAKHGFVEPETLALSHNLQATIPDAYCVWRSSHCQTFAAGAIALARRRAKALLVASCEVRGHPGGFVDHEVEMP
jgi:hypothetical protein